MSDKKKQLPICIRMNVYCDIDGIRSAVFNKIQDALSDLNIDSHMSQAEWDSMLGFIESDWQGDFRINIPVIIESDDKGGIEVSLDSGNWAGEVVDYDA